MLSTARNIFIVNLAVSNLLLCLFTMPLALIDLIHTYWPINEDYVGFVLANLNDFSRAHWLGCIVPLDQQFPVSIRVLFIILRHGDCSGQDDCRQQQQQRSDFLQHGKLPLRGFSYHRELLIWILSWRNEKYETLDRKGIENPAKSNFHWLFNCIDVIGKIWNIFIHVEVTRVHVHLR